jgi:hypothetical protein
MYKLFPLIIIFLLLSLPYAGRTEPPETCERNVISNLPECVANAVYEGKDGDMPQSSDYEMAIEPILDKNGNTIVPLTIPEALHAMHQMLPHWYLNALRRSQGDDECNVNVNRYSYGGLVTTWLWVHWKMNGKESVLRQQFAKLGIRENPDVEQAMMFGFCEFVKNGEAKALQVIAKRGSQRSN